MPRSRTRTRRWLGFAISASYFLCDVAARAQTSDAAPPDDAPEIPDDAPEIPEEDPESFGAAAKVDPPAREVTSRALRGPELVRMPGTRSDPLRAIELFPGVGRAQIGGGLPSIRGAGVADSQVFLEGIPVPLLYHFGAITSFVNGRLLDRVDFYPGNFSARYGRKMGGVIDVRLRDPKTDGLHGVADLNVIDASVLGEGPIGSRGSVAASVRRSHVDTYLKAVVPNDGDVAISAAPVYYDYQAIGQLRVGERGRLRLMAYGSRDSLELLFKKPSGGDPTFRGGIQDATEFHNVQLGLRNDLSDALEQNIEVALGTMGVDQRIGRLADMDMRKLGVYGRAEWKLRVAPALRLIGGLDHQSDFYRATYAGLAPRANFEDSTGGPPGVEQLRAFDPIRLPDHQSAAYLEAQVRPWDPLLLLPSVRVDHFDHMGAVTVDPRLATRIDVTETTTVKGGFGKFSQPAEFFYSLDVWGSRALTPSYALHSSAGLEQRLADGAAMVSAEAFHKSLHDLVVDSPGGRLPLFENAGRGRVYGVELFARVMPKGRFFGMLSYTMSRSERSAYGGPWALYDLDQTHNVVASGMYRLGRGWEAGASFRLVSGNPLTPVVRSTYDATLDQYRPTFGARNSERSPLFQRLDVRIEKKWTFSAWALATYLDVQNVYNARNQEGFSYNYDYTTRQAFYGLPILPSLGVRGEL